MNRYHIALGKKAPIKKPKKEPPLSDLFYSQMAGEIIERLFEAIKLFIAWAPNRKEMPPSYDGFSKDFNTFKVSLPRRAGNTTLALKLLEYYKDSVLIVVSEALKRDARCSPYRERIFGPTGRELCGHDTPIVIVDLASHIYSAEIEVIYSCFPRALFILIS